MDLCSGGRARAPSRWRRAGAGPSARRRRRRRRSVRAGAEFAARDGCRRRRPETELPPGPDSEAMQEQQALPEQKAETKETELPKDHSRGGRGARPRRDRERYRRSRTRRIRRSRRSRPPPPRHRRSRLRRRGRRSTKTRARPRRALAPVIGLGKDILKITADWNKKISRASRPRTSSIRRASSPRQPEGQGEFRAQPQGQRAVGRCRGIVRRRRLRCGRALDRAQGPIPSRSRPPG